MLTLIEIIIGRFVTKKVWVHDVSSEKLEINNKILGLDVHSTRSKGSNLSRFALNYYIDGEIRKECTE